MTVYVLQHVHTFDTGEEEVKMIGVYSTRATAEAAVERASRLPGFRDVPDGFEALISDVRKVTKLREVRALQGFTRLDGAPDPSGPVQKNLPSRSTTARRWSWPRPGQPCRPGKPGRNFAADQP